MTNLPARGLSNLDPARHVFDETLGRAPSRERMRGRSVLVVGAGQQAVPGNDTPPTGNGRAIAMLLAREGAQVACLDRDSEAAQATVELIRREGGRAVAIVADVAQP